MSEEGPVIHGEGTPEAAWHRWSRTFPPFSLDGCRRLVLIAPHPDDEVLGVGGLLALATAAEIDVRIVAVTDGGASHPGSPTLTPAALAHVRPQESARALAILGLDTVATRLGLPDGRVAEQEVAVRNALYPLLTDDDLPTWCLVTARFDGHPDHEATGRATAAVCADIGVRLLEYPVWTWHWASPDDARVPWSRARSIALPPVVTEAKRAAARCFRSQTEALSEDPADAPILPPHVLQRLLRTWEVVFV